jgi:hypothetical protein
MCTKRDRVCINWISSHTVQGSSTTFKFGVDPCGFWINQISGEMLVLKLRNPAEIEFYSHTNLSLKTEKLN